MIAVILSGHGGFASGLQQAVVQIIGEQEQFKAIDFPEGMTTLQLEMAMREAMTEIESADGVVFLTDLLGGSPFRTASLLSQEIENSEVVTGTNLQMVAEMLLERDGMRAEEFCSQALACGHRGMTCLSGELAKSHPRETVEDGI
jgi:PTS system N-acetylgalactosamine-specific IIA component